MSFCTTVVFSLLFLKVPNVTDKTSQVVTDRHLAFWGKEPRTNKRNQSKLRQVLNILLVFSQYYCRVASVLMLQIQQNLPVRRILRIPGPDRPLSPPGTRRYWVSMYMFVAGHLQILFP